MGDAKVTDEPILDSGSRYHSAIPSEMDIESHRSQRAVYVGVHMPPDKAGNQGSRRRRHHRRPRAGSLVAADGKRVKDPPLTGIAEDDSERATDASQHVMFLLGEEDEGDEPHQLFCEMDELMPSEEGQEWKETARWIKFEEDVEEGGERWSKPYVATLPLFSLFEVRSCLANGVILLNVEATTLEQIVELMLNKVIGEGKLDPSLREKLQDLLLKKHSHLHEKKHKSGTHLPLIRSLADIGRKHSSKDVDKEHMVQGSAPGLATKGSADLLGSSMFDPNAETNDLHSSPSSQKFDLHFLKKIPPGSETSNILVGETDFLTSMIVCLIRLKDAVLLGELTEVPVPTRFLFILLGPLGNASKFHEMGRSMATLMSDEIFHDVGYKARNREDLLAGIDEFLTNCTVLPPGEWDPTIRIEPPKSVPSQDSRKTPALPNGAGTGGTNGAQSSAAGSGGGGGGGHDEMEDHTDPTLVRTGRIFGGLVSDVKRKIVFYASDYKDAIHIQCFASFFFLYFACLTPIITFGGLLQKATGGYLGTMESILSGAIVGVTYALFSGQPLTILGSTGPVLVFENIVYDMCITYNWDYLSFRLWVGLWVGFLLLIVVALDLSALVRYITRFTEESFAFLIALIFIKEAIMKLYHIVDDYPVNRQWTPELIVNRSCTCVPVANISQYFIRANLTTEPDPPPFVYEGDRAVAIDWDLMSSKYFSWQSKKFYDLCEKWGGTWEGPCTRVYIPDVFFFSCLLFIGTFVISYALKLMRNSAFFPNFARSIISDFAVMIAITSMTFTDYLVGFHTPKLSVPSKFEPTLGYKARGWIVPLLNGNPGYTILIALGPALLAVILIFMDQQITAVIVNRKENKLKKGSGYHLDLLLVAILIIVNSILGIPWFVAATVLSINHVMSLKKESENNAPGERPVFLGCREQRVTGVIIFLTIGLSVFLTPVLQYIPMAVLYGVFLYMGVSSLRGVQLVQRVFLFVMPPKYQPDYTFLRHVPVQRVHLFTVIQVLCLSLLWAIKTIKVLSIMFPLMVLAMCFIRKALEKIFTYNELKWLDDIMPGTKKTDDDETKDHVDHGIVVDVEAFKCKGKMEKGGGDASSQELINISEEVKKTSIWKSLTQATGNASSDKEKQGSKKKKGDGSRHRRSHKQPTPPPPERESLLEMPEIVINPPSARESPETNRKTSDSNA